jgi:hypothetical protein
MRQADVARASGVLKRQISRHILGETSAITFLSSIKPVL